MVPPRPAPGWEAKLLEAEQLQRLNQKMAKGKAPGHDGWGQVWPNNGSKPTKTLIQILVSY